MRRLLAPGIAVLLAGGCNDACRNDIVSIAPAPDGKHQVAMFSRDCGATTGRSTQVSVLRAGDAPTAAGNAFVADGGTVSTAWGGPWAEVVWLTADQLLIRYDSRARIFEKAARINGVVITYQSVLR